MLLLVLALVVALVYLYFHFEKRLTYWTDRGVEQGNPKWLIGHFWENVIGKMNGVEIFEKVYKQSPNARYTGMYRFSAPVLMLRDPDLIKQITVREFDSFVDHSELIPPEADILWSKNLINLTGTKWRDMRNHLSPSFTSSKLRIIFELMSECAENLVQYILKKDQDVVTVEMKHLFSYYTNDVIASSAFGLKVDSFTQPNNKFYQMCNSVSDLNNIWKNLKILLHWCVPVIKNVLKIQFINDEESDYFRAIINDAIQTREERGIKRPDMLHLLLEARKSVQKQKESGAQKVPDLDLTNEDITAHAVIFIMAGFESVSNFICFATYELTINPDIQEKLREEVKATLEECDGKLTYEALLNMKYLDMVASETLRKWPHFSGTDRVCTRPFTIEPVLPGEKPLHLEKGAEVILPIYSIQNDPQNFPNPERFDPERFSEENKDSIHPYSYLPFGLGPRICIGSRFALLEAKMVLFQILTHFEIVPVEKTMIPLKFSKSTLINLAPDGGFWCGFKRCEKF